MNMESSIFALLAEATEAHRNNDVQAIAILFIRADGSPYIAWTDASKKGLHGDILRKPAEMLSARLTEHVDNQQNRVAEYPVKICFKDGEM
jgi:hypothetical protein